MHQGHAISNETCQQPGTAAARAVHGIRYQSQVEQMTAFHTSALATLAPARRYVKERGLCRRATLGRSRRCFSKETSGTGRFHLSGSRTTRLVDDLVAGGLATKKRCVDDGRGVDVTLTEDGLESLRRAYPVHLRSVRTRVVDHIPSSAFPGFAEAIRAIAEALE
jgi:hypothetical protein